MSKRRIALFIILSVLLTAVVTIAAQPMGDIKDNPHRNAIEQMVKLGVLSGRGNGLFYPHDNLNRSEAAKVAMFLAGFDEQDAAQAKAQPQAFNDVYKGMGDHEWALGWINLAAGEGIIRSYGDGKYGPGDNLQMAQWAAILIRILGYETKEGLKWPTGYDQMAGELGLTEGLEYVSNSYIRRDQMARLTGNAVYNVKRSNGLAIIDLMEGRAKDTEGQQQESMNMSVVSAPEVLPEGGGKIAAITVTVTDKAGTPVEGVKVIFHAYAFEADKMGDRNAQLSRPETTTDASGKAMTTYTTLAADDKRMVQIHVDAFNDDPAMEEFKDYIIMAVNQSAVVCGVVRDPYTGAPLEGVPIHFTVSKTMKCIGFVETDDQGRYKMVVPIGTYYVSFEMAIRDQTTVNASNPDQTYTIDNKKGILKGVITGVSPGNKVMAISLDFSPNGPHAWTLQADIQRDGSFTLALAPNIYELFICGDNTPFKTGVTVQRGQVSDMGTVKAR